MNLKPLHLTLALALVALAPLCLSQPAKQDKPAAAQQSADKNPAGVQSPPAHENEGEAERIFAQNCSRCHNAPDGFSSRISGTVLRHMRVRASLSKHDEEELFRFFNP